MEKLLNRLKRAFARLRGRAGDASGCAPDAGPGCGCADGSCGPAPDVVRRKDAVRLTKMSAKAG